jgi:ornithine cyclodeaminase/alanine dehydrogenase-like protein (mu-crystallin family)
MRSPIRYLAADDVAAAMPSVADRLDLAERTMTALVADAELPPKIGVHPRPAGSFAHAMPAALRPIAASDAHDDLLGIKWVTGFPENRALGLPSIHAVVVLTDPSTGEPRAILDGGPITAERTAAVSGVAIARFGPRAAATMGADDHVARATIIGAGVQGRSHLAVLGYALPGVAVTIIDRHPERAEAIADIARGTAGIGSATAATATTGADDPRAATLDADVVITAATFTDPAHRQVMDGSWLGPDALVVPVDYATMCAASVARDAALFLVDDRGQFLANRDAGQFDDYPDPTATIGEAILAGTIRPASGRVVITHLGVGLADVVFADAIVRRAEELGLGTMLPR